MEEKSKQVGLKGNIPNRHWEMPKFQKISEVYTEQRRELMAKVLSADRMKNDHGEYTSPQNPIAAGIQEHTLNIIQFPGKFRDGRQRDNWWIEGTNEYTWDIIAGFCLKRKNS